MATGDGPGLETGSDGQPETEGAAGSTGQELRQAFEAVYAELRLVAGRLAGGGRWPTGTPTDLVSEAVLRLLQSDSPETITEEGLRRMVPQIMRHVLIDRARMRNSVKREALGRAISEDDLISQVSARSLEVGAMDLVDLDEALDALAEVRPVTAEFIAARFFAGLSVDDAAKVVGIGSVKAALYWSEGLKFLQERFGLLEELTSTLADGAGSQALTEPHESGLREDS